MSSITKPKPQAKKITPKLKLQIMSEILLPDASIPDIARKYGLSSTTLYSWRVDHNKKLNEGSNNSGSKVSGDGFIELLAIESDKSSISKLSEISLILGNISLSIKGKVKISSLIKILNALEESC